MHGLSRQTAGGACPFSGRVERNPPTPSNLRTKRRNPYYIGVKAEPEGDFDLADQDANRRLARPAPQQITAGPPELETGGVLFIDLNAIVFNWRSLMQRAVPADCAAVVKADAYGCGIEPVTVELAKGGCRTFFVAHLAEARRLRAVAPEAVIYVLNGIAPGSAAIYATIDARPVIGTIAEFVEWDAFRRASGWLGGAALHFDTGMNRLGLSVNEAPALAARVKMPDHGIALIMTHLACAETPGHDSTTARPRRSDSCAICSAASPPRSPIPPASSSAPPPIATWCGRARRCTASIRRRPRRT